MRGRHGLARYLPRDFRPRFLAKMLLAAAALHVLITYAAVIAEPFWPDPFVVAVRSQLPTLTDAFAHTPRVEALLETGDHAGYPPETREARRLGYAVSHLIVAAGLAVILFGYAIFLMRGIRDESYAARVRGLVRPEADPVLILVIAAIPAAFAAGIGAALYLGFLSEAHDGLVPVWVAIIDMMLLSMLTLLAGPLHRLLVRRAA
jgi:hypothetical protein